MPIHFIPNDPLAVASLPMRQQKARRNRLKSLAGFSFPTAGKQALYELGTPDFLFWQCREAALAAVETWEKLAGKLDAWYGEELKLIPDGGTDLNAYYDRASLSFFQFTSGDKTTYSGASTDIVAHEAGHALLDVIRPDLWDSNLPETTAFHEAFGDCMAILTALADRDTREVLLSISPSLDKANFVEATGEDLADGVRRAKGPKHPAADARHALNNFAWQLPSTLPSSGPPNVLSSESHSFGRIFSGCFWDTLRNVYADLQQNEAGLWQAAEIVAKLLIDGVKAAPESARFFQSVGQAMVLADNKQSNGWHHVAIRDAFSRHGISLGSAAMVAPRARLAGAEPRFEAVGATMLANATRQDLGRRLSIKRGAKFSITPLEIGGEQLAKAVHYREISLTDIAPDLKGVVAVAPEPVLVGAMAHRAVLKSPLPDPATTEDEVITFVSSLLQAGQISFATPRKGRARAAVSDHLEPANLAPLTTHTVRSVGGKRLLVRVRFACPGACSCQR